MASTEDSASQARAQQGPGNPECSSLLCEEPKMELASPHTPTATPGKITHAKDSPLKGYPSTAWHIVASPRRSSSMAQEEGARGVAAGRVMPRSGVAVAPMRAGQQMAGAPELLWLPLTAMGSQGG